MRRYLGPVATLRLLPKLEGPRAVCISCAELVTECDRGGVCEAVLYEVERRAVIKVCARVCVSECLLGSQLRVLVYLELPKSNMYFALP